MRRSKPAKRRSKQVKRRRVKRILSWDDLLVEIASAVQCQPPYIGNKTVPKTTISSVSSVYFILGTTTRRIKIGQSMNVPERFRALQSAASENLELLLVLPGKRDAEYHRKFKKFRIRREWFEGSPQILRFINSKIKKH